jgi:hypothetical protein
MCVPLQDRYATIVCLFRGGARRIGDIMCNNTRSKQSEKGMHQQDANQLECLAGLESLVGLALDLF